MRMIVSDDDGNEIGSVNTTLDTRWRDLMLMVSGLWAAESVLNEAVSIVRHASPDVVQGFISLMG